MSKKAQRALITHQKIRNKWIKHYCLISPVISRSVVSTEFDVLYVGACGQVDRASNSRSEGLGFHSQCWSCVEVLGKLRITPCFGPPIRNEYLHGSHPEEKDPKILKGVLKIGSRTAS